MKTLRMPILGGSAPVGQGIRLLLVMALLFSDGIGALAAKDLWSDRREAVRQTRNASVPERGSPLEKLAAAFPLMNNGAPLLPPAPAARSAFPEWLESAVALYADVGESHLPAPGEHRVLIHIQDLHEVEEAQRNTAAILEQLAESLGGTKGLLVGLEGATGGFRTADFRALAFPPIIGEAANRFLKAGLISGPEYFSLITERPVRLWGVEESRSYENNIKALTDTFSRQAKDDATMVRALSLAEGLKEQIYSPEIKDLDRLRTQYDAGHVGLVAYVKKLSSGVPADWIGENLRIFIDALDREDDLSFARVSEDQTRLLEKLSPLLDENEVRRLVDQGLAHRWGRTPFSKFHSLLQSLCAKHGVPLKKYPALLVYAEYASKAEGVNPTRLMQDVEALSDRRFQALLTSPALTELASLDADARLVDKLNRFVLRPEEYQRLVSRRDSIVRWHDRGAVLGTGDWPDLGPLVLSHEKFYLYAETRNRPLVQNLLPLWDRESPAVLVAGGYHGDGVRAVALSQGLGYISLIPRVSSTKGFPPPLESFRRGGSPSKWVFPGDRSALHNRLETAVVSPGFLRSFLGLTVGLTAGGAVRREEELLLPVLQRRMRRALEKTIRGARVFGVELEAPEKLPLLKRGPDGNLEMEVVLRLKNGSEIHSSLRMVEGGPEFVEVTVLIVAPPWYDPLVNRLGFLNASVLTVALFYDLKDRAADFLSRLSYELGQATQKSATVAAKGILWVGQLFELDRLNKSVGRWVKVLQYWKERDYLASTVLPAPFGLRHVLLAQLAAAHLIPLEKVWVKGIDEFLGSNSAQKSFRETSDNRSMVVDYTFEENSVPMRFYVTDARVLADLPEGDSLFHLLQGEAGFDVYLHVSAVSSVAILHRVLAQILREVKGRTVNNLDAEEAHLKAIRPLDQLENTRAILISRYQNAILRLDGEINVSSGGPIKLAVVSDLVREFSNLWMSSVSSLPFVSGATKWVSDLSQKNNLGTFNSAIQPVSELWPLEIQISHLKNSIEVLRRLSEFEDQRQKNDFQWPWATAQTPLIDQVTELVLTILSSVGQNQGREAASVNGPPQPGSTLLQDSLVASVSNQFPPLAQTLLGLLSLSGVHVEKADWGSQDQFVTNMLRVYMNSYQAGFLEVQPVVSSMDHVVNSALGTATSLVAGVIDLSGGEESKQGELLLKFLMQRTSPDHDRALVLSDAGREEVIESLVERLEREYPSDSDARKRAIAWLRKENMLAVVPFSDVRVDGAISQAAVFHQVQTLWRGGVSWVNIFASDPKAFRLDAGDSVLSWAMYDENLFLVSEQMAIEGAKQAIRLYIRQQA